MSSEPEIRELVAQPAAVEHAVSAISLPAGRAAVLRHVGPYQGLRDAFGQLRSWIDEHGEAVAGPPWEVYVTDPRTEPDASGLITDIYQRLR
jgi:effector-binding domain-containing protein